MHVPVVAFARRVTHASFYNVTLQASASNPITSHRRSDVLRNATN